MIKNLKNFLVLDELNKAQGKAAAQIKSTTCKAQLARDSQLVPVNTHMHKVRKRTLNQGKAMRKSRPHQLSGLES